MLNRLLNLKQDSEAVEAINNRHYRWIMVFACLAFTSWSLLVEHINYRIHDPVHIRVYLALPFFILAFLSFFVTAVERRIYAIFVIASLFGTIINFYFIYQNNMAIEYCAGSALMMYCILILIKQNLLKYIFLGTYLIGIAYVSYQLFASEILTGNQPTTLYLYCYFIVAFFVFVSIYTENRSKEILDKKLAENTKLKEWSAMGKMAGGIAHEINSPLTTLMFSADSIHKQAEKIQDKSIMKFSKKILNAADKIGVITKSLRLLTEEAHSSDKQVCDLKELLQESVEVFHNDLLLTDVDIENLIPSDREYMVLGDPYILKLVFDGIINNAIEAAAQSEERLVNIKIDVDRHTYKIMIQDSGPGIDKELLPSLFTPFSGAKQNQLTKGLSLSMSKNQIMAHDGDIFFSSDYNYTTFVIELPKYKSQEREAV